jgi:hypothetical protein
MFLLLGKVLLRDFDVALSGLKSLDAALVIMGGRRSRPNVEVLCGMSATVS